MAYKGSPGRFRKIRGDRFVANMGGERPSVKWTSVDAVETGPKHSINLHEFMRTNGCGLTAGGAEKRG